MAVKTERGRLLLWILLLLFYFGGLLTYGKLRRADALYVLLTVPCPAQTQAEEIVRSDQENGFGENSCFVQDRGLSEVEDIQYGRKCRVAVEGIYGNAALFDWRLNGFSRSDAKGCVIDRRTAMELFGSTNVEGKFLLFQGEQYQIRKIVGWKQKILVIHPPERESVYTKVFLKREEEGAAANTVSGFLMRYTLAGTFLEEGMFESAARFALFLLPGAWFLSLYVYALRERRASGQKDGQYWLWTGICAGMAVLVFWVVWKNAGIPSDWLPDKWSDFQFWSDKLDHLSESLSLCFLFSKTPLQTENLMLSLQSVFLSLGSLVLYLAVRVSYSDSG